MGYDNLIASTYVHSHVKYFLEVLGGKGTNPENLLQNGQALLSRLTSFRSKLEGLQGDCVNREMQFFADYGIGGDIESCAREWTAQHLFASRDPAQDKAAAVNKVLHSEPLRASFRYWTDEQLRKINTFVEQQAENYGVDAKEITQDIDLNSMSTNVVQQLFTKFDMFNQTGKIQEEFLKGLADNFKLESPKIMRKLSSANSRKLAKLNNAIEAQKDGYAKTLDPIINTFRRELENSTYFQDKREQIEPIVSAFKAVVTKEVQSGVLGAGLLSASRNKRVGTLEEINVILTNSNALIEIPTGMGTEYTTTNAEGDKIVVQSLANLNANELVDRGGNKVQSKIDAVIMTPEGNSFNVQVKTSASQLYETMDPSKRYQMFPGQIHLQGAINYSGLVERFKLASNFDDRELELLNYIIANYAALKSFSVDEGSLSEVHTLIEEYLSGGLLTYISDLIPKDGDVQVNSYDFINFRNELLIPMSLVYGEFVRFIDSLEKPLMALKATIQVGDNSAIAKELFLAKREMIYPNIDIGDFDSALAQAKKVSPQVLGGYGTDNLVSVGSSRSKDILNNINIKNLRLMFDAKQLYERFA